MIRLTVPTIEEDDLAAVSEALATGFLVQGRRVEAFETVLAERIGVDEAVALSSGTAALHLSLLALGVGPGDRVAVPAYSFIASANVVEICGATPVFLDIEAETFALDPARLADALRRYRLRAILPVHPFGHLADMPAIREAAGDIPVVEDGAAALGAMLNGKPGGTWGTLGCFSFHPRKAITTGEGGAVTTNDQGLARRIRALRNHGQDPASPTPDFVVAGLNYRMTEFQAALGSSQMAKLDRIIEGRRAAAGRYDTMLSGTPIRPPIRRAGSEPVYQSYVVLLPEGTSRDRVIVELRRQEIEAQIGTWHMPLARYYHERYGYRAGDFPVTDSVFARTLTLPLHPSIPEPDQAFVVDRLLALL